MQESLLRTQVLELVRTDAELRGEVERLVLNSAVMQELRALREDMNRRFGDMDSRFRALREDMDRRFEAVDRRFEAVDRRFEAMIAELQSVKDGVSALGSR